MLWRCHVQTDGRPVTLLGHQSLTLETSVTKRPKRPPRCLGERPNKTLNVLKQKENDGSTYVTIHSETAYDDVGVHGQGPEPSSAAETPTAYPQFILNAQCPPRTY